MDVEELGDEEEEKENQVTDAGENERVFRLLVAVEEGVGEKRRMAKREWQWV
jgi:hypothetical protein